MVAQKPVCRYPFFRMRPAPKLLLEAAGLPALLISDLTNIRYLSGMQLSSGLLLATSKAYVLYVDPRYEDGARRNVLKDVSVRPLDRLAADMKRVPECGYEEEDVSMARMRRWKKSFPATRLTRAPQAVEEFRRVKDEQELKKMRRAIRITHEMFRRVPSALRRPVTEKALAWKLETWARELGADGMSFPPIVAFGTHSASPHHEPTTRVLQRGHVVLVDAGAAFQGYKADMTRTYFTAQPTDAQAAAYRAVEAAKEAAEALVRPGALTTDIDAAARAALRDHGKLDAYLTHSLGHGVGLDIHEGVSLSVRSEPRPLLPGEVVTVEPGVYFPGKFGIRLEDTLIVA